jgi:polyferredoxin
LNTTLSALLTFSDHVLYRQYLQAPRLFGTTALGDQSCAGVLMWVPGSLVFLVPAALIAMQYLSAGHRLVRPQLLQSLPLRDAPVSQSHHQTKPRPGIGAKRFDLLAVPLVGPFLRTQSGRRLLQATLFIIALAVIVDGLVGPQVSSANLAGVLPWTYWRALVVLGLLAAGNFFCMACPFMFFRELGRRLGLRQRSWPRALRSKWFGIALLGLFFWGYEVFSLWDNPIWTAWVLINYFLVAFAIDALFRGASFCKYVCPIGQFQFVTSLVSPLEVKVRQPDVCAHCKTHDCLRGNESHRGCVLDLYLPRKSGNLDCTFCLDCVRACPHDNIGMMTVAPGMDIVRDPNRASVGRVSGRLDLAALALAFVFGAFANAAFMTAPVASLEANLAARLGLTSPRPVTSVILFMALFMAPAALATLSGYVSHAASHASATMRELLCRFSMSLVPLGAAMWAGHYLFHLAVGWDSGWTTVQHAASRWHLLSSPNSVISSPLMGGDTISIVQALLLDAGLLLTLYLVWRIALVYVPRVRGAFRLFAPWAGVATALYAAGVWIILQPMQMRGLSAPLSLP